MKPRHSCNRKALKCGASHSLAAVFGLEPGAARDKIFYSFGLASNVIDDVQFNSDGLVPVIAQDASSGQVLMFAWMNAEALVETATSGQAVYFSRSRQKLWRKGESSGNTQAVQSLRLDCDGDVILMKVEQQGGIACHTGRAHCFYRRLTVNGAGSGSWETTESVIKDPKQLYGDSDQ